MCVFAVLICKCLNIVYLPDISIMFLPDVSPECYNVRLIWSTIDALFIDASNVGIAIINHPFLMVYTIHFWRLGGWFILAIPTLSWNCSFSLGSPGFLCCLLYHMHVFFETMAKIIGKRHSKWGRAVVNPAASWKSKVFVSFTFFVWLLCICRI